MNRSIPAPRTDSGWSWYDFWNWYRVQPEDVQQWTMQTNKLLDTIRTMAPDVQNEALYYAPETVQAIFEDHEQDNLLQQAMEIMRNL